MACLKFPHETSLILRCAGKVGKPFQAKQRNRPSCGDQEGRSVLECEVKWALESITTNKASGGNGIPVELLQILKDDAVKVLHSIWQQIWKTQQWPQDWKSSVFIPVPKKGNAKECSNYHKIALISHSSKVMLKILQARLQQYTNPTLVLSKWALKVQKSEKEMTCLFSCIAHSVMLLFMCLLCCT